MFGTALRLLAAGQAGRYMGDYVKNLVTKYLVLSVAGIVFLGAIVFGILAAFWAINSSSHNPVTSAGIMAGILALVGCLIALIAYGISREKPKANVSQAFSQPVQTLQGQIPSVEDVGRQIEHAVKQYGPIRVATAAAAGGIIAGLIAKRYGEFQLFGRSRRDERRSGDERRYASGRRYENGRRYA